MDGIFKTLVPNVPTLCEYVGKKKEQSPTSFYLTVPGYILGYNNFEGDLVLNPLQKKTFPHAFLCPPISQLL